MVEVPQVGKGCPYCLPSLPCLLGGRAGKAFVSVSGGEPLGQDRRAFQRRRLRGVQRAGDFATPLPEGSELVNDGIPDAGNPFRARRQACAPRLPGGPVPRPA